MVAGGAPPCRSFKTFPNPKNIPYLDILFHVEYISGLSFSKQSLASSRSNKQIDEKETTSIYLQSLALTLA